MSNQEINVWLKLKGDLSKDIKSIAGTFSTFAKDFARNFTNIHFAIKDGLRVLKEGWEALESVTKIEQQETAFKNLAASYGANSRQMVNDLRKASAETLSTMDIMEQASKAMTLGLDPAQFGKLMEISRAAARAMGSDVDFMFQSIVLGIGRQSRMILDNLGIIVKADDAYKDYAKVLGKTVDNLTDAEKRQAFMNATIKAGESIIKKVNVAEADRAEQLQKITSSLKDIKDNVLAIVAQKANLQDLSSILGDLSVSIIKSSEQKELLQGTWQLEALGDRVKDLRGEIQNVQGLNLAFGVTPERIALLTQYRAEIEAITETARQMKSPQEDSLGTSANDGTAELELLQETNQQKIQLALTAEQEKIENNRMLWAMYHDEEISNYMAQMQQEQEIYQIYLDNKRKADQSYWVLANKEKDVFGAGISKMFGDMMKGTFEAKAAFKELGIAMVQTLIDFMVQKLLAKAMSDAIMTETVAVSVAAATIIAAAWAPAAAAVSLATEGANSIPAGIGIAAVHAQSRALSIPALADGGIVDKPTIALIGERGREAVIPLSRGGGVGGNNITIEMYNPVITSDEVANDVVNKIIEQVSYVLNRESERA